MGVHYNKADFITYGKPSLFLDFANKKSLTDRISGNNLITFTRSSTGTYVGSDGLIKSAAVNEGRFDHNPTTGESLGLLIEEGRSNLVTNSENISTWGQNNVTVSGEVMNGPAGNISYSKVTLNTFTNNRGFISIGISNNPSTLYTTSAYLKAGTCRYVILTTNAFNSNNYGAYFDLQTGIMYNNRSAVAFNSVNVGNGWYRLSVVVDSLTGGSGRNVFIFPVPISNPTQGPSNNIDPYYDANGEYLYVWGVQCEQGSFPTSYIPTSGTTVTRSADVASITGSNLTSFYNQSQGTLFCRFRNFGYGDAYHAGGGGVSFDNNQFQRNMISLNMRRDGPFYRNGALVIFNDTTFTDSLTTSGSSNNINDTVNYYNFVGSFSSTKRAFTYNGITPGVNSTTITMPTISRFSISTNSNYAYDPFTGYISRISYYPSQLTDTQLQSLTR